MKAWLVVRASSAFLRRSSAHYEPVFDRALNPLIRFAEGHLLEVPPFTPCTPVTPCTTPL